MPALKTAARSTLMGIWYTHAIDAGSSDSISTRLPNGNSLTPSCPSCFKHASFVQPSETQNGPSTDPKTNNTAEPREASRFQDSLTDGASSRETA